MEAGQLDLHRFEQGTGEAKAAAEAGRPHDAARSLHEALSLWRGPALADLGFEGALQTDIARLEELRLDALEERFEADLALLEEAAAARLVGEVPARRGSAGPGSRWAESPAGPDAPRELRSFGLLACGARPSAAPPSGR